jgi:hypothetical protein
MIIHAFREFDLDAYYMCNAFPWLFPGGMADIYDEDRGKEDIRDWARHLLKFFDGRFERVTPKDIQAISP